MVRPLGAEPLGDAQPVDRVHPLAALGHVAGLVRLQLADEMPGERPPAQGVDLRDGLLDVVLSELRLTERGQGAHGFHRLLLADREQADIRGVPAGTPGGDRDPGAYGLESGG